VFISRPAADAAVHAAHHFLISTGTGWESIFGHCLSFREIFHTVWCRAL